MQIKAAIAESLKEGVKPKQPVNQYINDDDSDNDAFDNDSDNEEPNSCFENKISNAQSAQNFKVHSSSKSGKEAKVDEDWRLYLGPDDGKKIEFVVRYPDGDKENITFPVESKLKVK